MVREKNGYLEFVSFPSSINDVIIIYGHNGQVKDYIEDSIIEEKRIYLITCKLFSKIPKIIKNKEIYISKLEEGITNLYDGSKYGFDFGITNTEILMYNYRTKSFEEQMSNSYERLK